MGNTDAEALTHLASNTEVLIQQRSVNVCPGCWKIWVLQSVASDFWKPGRYV